MREDMFGIVALLLHGCTERLNICRFVRGRDPFALRFEEERKRVSTEQSMSKGSSFTNAARPTQSSKRSKSRSVSRRPC